MVAGFRTVFCIPALALFACASACSSPAADEADSIEVNDRAGDPTDDPPGAALPLSLGRQETQAGDDAFASAVNCAAALALTAERLAQMSSDPASREIALMNRAQRYFEARAQSAQPPEGGTSVAAAVGLRREEKSGETAQQAQLAIACLRRFGDQSGAVSDA